MYTEYIAYFSTVFQAKKHLVLLCRNAIKVRTEKKLCFKMQKQS